VVVSQEGGWRRRMERRVDETKMQDVESFVIQISD
jgi:hypothetical protein